jgi:hypothetical protein
MAFTPWVYVATAVCTSIEPVTTTVRAVRI